MIPLLLALTATIDIDRGQRFFADHPHPLGPVAYVASVDGGPDQRLPVRAPVAPGAHSVTVWTRTVWGKREPVSTTVTVGTGETRALRVNVYQGGNGLGWAFGVAGALVQGDQRGEHAHGVFVEDATR